MLYFVAGKDETIYGWLSEPKIDKKDILFGSNSEIIEGMGLKALISL